MGGRRAGLISSAVVLAAASPAVAANPQLAYLQKTLKKNMVAKFKTEAPGLVVTKVACKLPSGNGRTAKCVAHFKAGSVTGYYNVAATLKANGKLSWTSTGSPVCFNAKGKKRAC